MSDSHSLFAQMIDPDFDAPAPAPAPTPSQSSYDGRGRLESAHDALTYALAGKAILTLASAKTGTRFTYRLSANEDRTCYFVSVLTGADNTRDYSYLGRISRNLFWHGRKMPRPGDIGANAPSAVAFAWTWKALIRNVMPPHLEIYHESSCGRCGRKLTVPSSVQAGFGPECAGKL